MSKLAVVAIGGNSLIRDKAHESVEDQYLAVVETAKHIVGMIEQGYEVIITHGNGPQVGFILRRSEIAKDVAAMHEVPLVSCGAERKGRSVTKFNKQWIMNLRKGVLTNWL